MPASLRGAPFGVPVVPEVRITIRVWWSGTPSSGVVGVAVDEAVERVGLAASSPSVHDSTRVSTWAFSSIEVNSVVVDHDGGVLPLEHVDQLRAGERGVEVEQVGAELGRGHGGLDEAAVVAGHQRDRVALLDPQVLEPAGQRVGAPGPPRGR